MLNNLNANLWKYQDLDEGEWLESHELQDEQAVGRGVRSDLHEQQGGLVVGDRQDYDQGPHEVQVEQQQGGRVRNTSV